MHNAEQLNVLSVTDLKAIAESLLIPKTKISKLKKGELVELILKQANNNTSEGLNNTTTLTPVDETQKEHTHRAIEQISIESESTQQNLEDLNDTKALNPEMNQENAVANNDKKIRNRINKVVHKVATNSTPTAEIKESTTQTVQNKETIVEEKTEEKILENKPFEHKPNHNKHPKYPNHQNGNNNRNNNSESKNNEVVEELSPIIEEEKKEIFNIDLDGVIPGEGVLEIIPEGYGFLRS
ncbi:MAG TPA: Rho termination factor N-terminal domain-containing protein, partial [Chitinophagales bacterium]|nr:Rho termination factor N-terminal domain-containing protein [Chitinophagales bacterium]HMZ93070.1 Rho termination factor N-terminal domain-containing protein [Chitinophagales bacterium]